MFRLPLCPNRVNRRGPRRFAISSKYELLHHQTALQVASCARPRSAEALARTASGCDHENDSDAICGDYWADRRARPDDGDPLVCANASGKRRRLYRSVLRIAAGGWCRRAKGLLRGLAGYSQELVTASREPAAELDGSRSAVNSAEHRLFLSLEASAGSNGARRRPPLTRVRDALRARHECSCVLSISDRRNAPGDRMVTREERRPLQRRVQ